MIRPTEIEMGGTGDPPVPSGHWPDGIVKTLTLEKSTQKICVILSIPGGGSPPGTPMGMAAISSKFGQNESFFRIYAN